MQRARHRQNAAAPWWACLLGGAPAGPGMLRAIAFAAGLALATGPAPAGAQTSVPGSDPLQGRLVERVTFHGNEIVGDDALRENLATRPTRCRGLLLQPFCWLIDSDVVIERNYLDVDALPLDELRILVLYFRAGFRDAAVESVLQERDGRVGVAFHIEEGPPTLVGDTEVRQHEEVLTEGEVRRLGLPEPDAPLDLDRLVRSIDTAVELLGERGFLDGTVRDSIDVVDRTADIVLTVDPGRRSTLARYEVSGNQEIERDALVRGLLLDEGDVLTRPMVQQMRRTLYQSNLFHEVEISVPEEQDSAKVVQIRVREAPPRLARAGGGFNTLEFAQLEGRFTHYNWLGGGRRVDLRVNVGNLLAPQLNDWGPFRDVLPGELSGVDESPFERPTWQVSAEFTQPHFRGAENVLGFSAFAHRRVIPAISVDRGYGGEVSVTRRLGFRVPLSLAYRYEIIAVTAGDVHFCVSFGICDPPVIRALRGRNSLSPLSLAVHMDRTDDALAPTIGYRVRADAEHASQYTISDFHFNRVSGEASYYRPFGGEPRHVVGARVRVGWVEALESTRGALGILGEGRDLIHPRKRFFAGGARSVRGYAENQLGPRVLTIPREALLDAGCEPEEIQDRTCDPALAPVDAFYPRPLGGSAVLEGNLEYRFPVWGLTGALFVDGALVGGRLSGLLQDAARGVSPGFGVRFDSPAGPIRIDLGIRPRLVQRLPVVTEMEAEAGEVIERRLVQLQQRRRFDPLEGEGFPGSWLGRLTLHFSIGEAF